MLQRILLALLGVICLGGAAFLVLPVWVNFPDSGFGLVIICLLLVAAFVSIAKAYSGIAFKLRSGRNAERNH